MVMTSSVVIVVVMNSSLTRVVGTAVMVLMTLPDSVMWVPMVSVTKVVKNLVSRVGTTTSVVMTVTTSSAGAAAPATTESGDSLRTVWCLIRTLSDSEGGKNEGKKVHHIVCEYEAKTKGCSGCFRSEDDAEEDETGVRSSRQVSRLYIPYPPAPFLGPWGSHLGDGYAARLADQGAPY